MESFFLTKPAKVGLCRHEIQISETDFEKNESHTVKRLPEEIGEIAFISDKSSVSKGAVKKLVGKNISFISKGTPIAFVAWVAKPAKFFQYSKKMAELQKSKQQKLGFAFCKGVCLGRIYEARRLNEKRESKKVAQYLKQMTVLERRLKKEYKDKARLMGLEGNIAKLFFSCIQEFLPKETGFKARDVAGKDLYNSLLNASHGVLRMRIQRRLISSGLNPAFGFLHFEKDKAKPFLAWDFAELWIPYVDKLCFYAINKGIFSEKDLVNSKNGDGKKWLNAVGWKKLYKLFERVDDREIERKIMVFCDYLDGKQKRFGWRINR